MPETRAKILVIDDDPDIRLLAGALLEHAGYLLIVAESGRLGLAAAFAEHPDLILLDCDMPEFDGFQVLAELRKHLATRNLPVLLLTARAEVVDRVRGLDAGADDYIVKPFAQAEFLARISVALRRHQRDVAADPLTKLPGNLALRQEISRRWGGAFSVAYFDLDHFKAYVDSYGFERASLVVQKVGQLLYNAVIDNGFPEDFVGHIGGDDFLLIATPDRAHALCHKVRTEFLSLREGFYGSAHFEAGFIEGVDRYGEARRFDLLDLSIAILNIAADAPHDREKLGAFASVCKSRVKGGVGDDKLRGFAYPPAEG